MPFELDGLHSHIRIDLHAEERAISVWIRGIFHRFSTYETRVFARHLLELADKVDDEANRASKFAKELLADVPAPAPTEPPTPPVKPAVEP